MQNKQDIASNIQKKKLIAFIITTYNEPLKYIIKSLENILKLPLQENEREIIIVNDGGVSYDEKLYEIDNQIIIIKQKNKGVSVARNEGMKKATGHYIQFIDGDDYIIPHTFSTILELARKYNPDIITHNFTSQKITKFTSIKIKKYNTSINYMQSNNLRGSAWGYIFKKDILHDLSFTPGVTYSEDEEFTTRLFLQGRDTINTNCKCYFYRQHEKSITHQQDSASIYKRLEETEKTLLKLNEIRNKLPENARKAIRRKISQLTMDYLYNTISLTKSSEYLSSTIRNLKKNNLFPLSPQKYTVKYSVFRILLKYRLGRFFLLKAIR